VFFLQLPEPVVQRGLFDLFMVCKTPLGKATWKTAGWYWSDGEEIPRSVVSSQWPSVVPKPLNPEPNKPHAQQALNSFPTSLKLATPTARTTPTTQSTRTTTRAAVAPTKKAAPAFNSSARIPRILHQAFASEMVYENYLPYINSCMALNPDWTYYLWRDSDAEALISSAYPEFLAKYKKYSDVLERADSIRYIVLHHFGGIYLDMDVQCVRPFFPALENFNSFLDQERIEQTNIFWGWPFSVMNSAMGSAPGHPFFREVINEMLHKSQIGNAFATTGPAILTQVYKQYTAVKPAVPVTLLEPNVMSPLMDGNKNWRSMCGSLAAAKSKPDSRRSWKERGCIMLESKNWRYDDSDNSTICVHRFLHLGYGFAAGARKKPFNVTARFWPRVRTFK
uniref:Glycosyltransferase family 32 protein n=1 Tax=Macrostomum lignano TaxID=282301 RepID=A0A1I8FWN5_9PLAT